MAAVSGFDATPPPLVAYLLRRLPSDGINAARRTLKGRRARNSQRVCQPVSSSLEHLRFPFGGGGNRGPEVRSPAGGCLEWTCGSAPARPLIPRPGLPRPPAPTEGTASRSSPTPSAVPGGVPGLLPVPSARPPPVCSTDRDLGALAARARGSGLPGYKPPSRAAGPQGLSVAVALVLRATYTRLMLGGLQRGWGQARLVG